jgi:hypothetical protein
MFCLKWGRERQLQPSNPGIVKEQKKKKNQPNQKTPYTMNYLSLQNFLQAMKYFSTVKPQWKCMQRLH